MDTSAAQTAISLALSGKWKEAVDANLQIIKEDDANVDALCRLSRAYAELGKIEKAKESTLKVLKIDPTNQIALKFIEKLKLSKSKGGAIHSPTCTESFLEEPGKTKIIELMNLGDPENYAEIDPGEEVKLTPYPHRVAITTKFGKYIGRLPDDIAARLKGLLKHGYKYLTLIKSVDTKAISVFIREVEKGRGAADVMSFPPEKIDYVSFTPPELVHRDTPSTETTEEIPEG